MAINPDSLGATSGPRQVSWTDRDTLLYALGVGAGADELSLVTENSHGVTQQVLPTFAVIVAAGFDVLPKVGKVNWGALLHGAQEVRVHRPLPPQGTLSVVAEISDLQDKGEGRNAIVTLTGRGSDPETGALVAETVTTLVLRGQGGFGGSPGTRAKPAGIPDRAPDEEVSAATDERQPLIYRLSGDRNPLHSDPWFARNKAGFPGPILHGLCTYGVAGRLLVRALCDGDTSKIAGIAARFTAPVFPGDRLSTSIWRTGDGSAVFRTSAVGPDGTDRGVVLDEGRVELGGRP
ncbi:dehydrogenase [Actinomadura sp. LD22]|uniref:Dehydrogenase n=1 Tax=Actinomadura physcomitrii TaxID=2650748 RepID=A0A6I4MKG5_9ACTN|nr:MaoC/PaaZ C-terminal domain-containing protein [Actinomadura physcomitrii]MWA03199.1 dehydrogenase [Actinomadura physcomitrii]